VTLALIKPAVGTTGWGSDMNNNLSSIESAVNGLETGSFLGAGATGAQLQSAVDAVPRGGVLRLGTGTFVVPAGGLVISKSIVLEGTGSMFRYDAHGTVLTPAGARNATDQPIISIVPSESEMAGDSSFHSMTASLRNLNLFGNGERFAAGSYGVVCNLSNTTTVNLHMEHCTIKLCCDDGVHITGDGGANAVVGGEFNGVDATYNWGHGLYITGSTVVKATSCFLVGNWKFGAYAVSTGIRFDNCTFESNSKNMAVSESVDAQLCAFDCNVMNVTGCHFENFDGATRAGVAYYGRKAIHAHGCTGLLIQGSVFINGPPAPVTSDNNIAIYLTTDGSGTPGMVAANYFQGCYIGVCCGDGTIYPRSMAAAHVFEQQSSPGGCTVPFLSCQGTGFTRINPDFVQMSTASAEGMHYWDTTNHRLMVWDGSAWFTATLGEPVYYNDEPVTYNDSIVCIN